MTYTDTIPEQQIDPPEPPADPPCSVCREPSHPECEIDGEALCADCHYTATNPEAARLLMESHEQTGTFLRRLIDTFNERPVLSADDTRALADMCKDALRGRV